MLTLDGWRSNITLQGGMHVGVEKITVCKEMNTISYEDIWFNLGICTSLVDSPRNLRATQLVIHGKGELLVMGKNCK